MNSTDPDKTFLVHAPARNLTAFRACAESVARLKRYGAVQVNISALADKAWYMMPEGGCPWREYANYNPTPIHFFPHPTIAPHLPAEWVARNRELLLAKAAVLDELDLGASFWGHEPHFLPESFFEAHPHLRGPRVDHPRRSRAEAFALCVDVEESLEMISWMLAELKRAVPALGTYQFKTNDAGSGLCWAAAQYAGPNGPRHCQGRGAGQRVRGLVEAIHRGAEAGGGAITVRIGNANFWNNEVDLIAPHLPPRTFLAARDRSTMHVGSLLAAEYPVLGLVDPLAIVASMERFGRPDVRTVFLDFRSSYDRAGERQETIDKVVEIVEDCIAEPAIGFVLRLGKLEKLAAQWGGDRYRDGLVEAFYGLHEALKLKRAVAPKLSALNNGVSLRCITRPLVIKPELLTPEEESYFLPHVFNIHESEARADYNDLHGGKLQPGPLAQGHANIGLAQALAQVRSAAKTFAQGAGTPEGAWLGRLASSWRIWASLIRSAGNFYGAQLIRDRNREALAGEPRIPEKVATTAGHPDFLPFNEIMRDELDNTHELIALLEGGGLALLARAEDARHEDTFLLGPDVVDQLRQKVRIMRAHWRDIEKYLASPHK